MAKERRTDSFEQLYARLEETVAKLEQGGLALEDAIALYEDGMTLAKQCQERLDEAEQKITKLRESFADMAGRGGARIGEASEDYEYDTDGERYEESAEAPPD